MISYNVLIALPDKSIISPKARHLLINLNQWAAENKYSHFVFTTKKREKDLKLSSNQVGVYVKNNYHAELTELVAEGYLVASDLLKQEDKVSYSIAETLTKSSDDKPPFSSVAIELITSNRIEVASLLKISPERLEDIENFELVSKGKPQKKNTPGSVRFMRPQQITFGTLLCLANESGVIKAEQGEVASVLGIKTKTLRNHLSQFHKLGLFSEQIGGLVGSSLIGKAKSVYILKPELVIENYQLHSLTADIIMFDNPIRQKISLMLDLAGLSNNSQRLTALKGVSEQQGIKLAIPDELTSNHFTLLRKLFTTAPPLGERPYKHFCLLIEEVVIGELKRSGFENSDSEQPKDDRSSLTFDDQYALFFDVISKVITGPLTKSMGHHEANQISDIISGFMASAAVELFCEIQSAVIDSPPFSDKPSDELRQKKFMLYPAGKNFFSSSQKLLVVG